MKFYTFVCVFFVFFGPFSRPIMSRLLSMEMGRVYPYFSVPCFGRGIPKCRRRTGESGTVHPSSPFSPR